MTFNPLPSSTTTIAPPVGSPVEFMRPEVADRLLEWERIQSAVEGEEAVKKLGDKVLPRPNAEDISLANQTRYASYLGRAVFYNVSGRTLDGLVGYVFSKEPIVTLPLALAAIEKNVDGSGVTINQQAKAALRLVLSLGRAGLLVDFPSTNNAVSQADIAAGSIAPTIVLYDPEQIINWRTSYQGARGFLDLVVLREGYVDPDTSDEFKLATRIQYRVLTRNSDGVLGRIYRQQGEGQFVLSNSYTPKDKNGNPLREIPFIFLGADNNDEHVDTSPIKDLVDLNLAHYRNSADYEESCYLVGQPTPWMSGLSQAWVDDVLKGEVFLGSRSVIPLPQGATAGLLQANPNTLPFEAMQHKERQMVALGAKIVEQKEVQRTATEAGLEHAGEVSTLTAAAENIFLGYKRALVFAGAFVGAEIATIDFDLTEALNQKVLSPEEAAAVVAAWQGGLIDYEEARWAFKKGGLAWKDDDEVKEANDADGLRLPPAPPAPEPEPE
jgi:hypothetical protein